MSLISPYISPTSRLYLACISPTSRDLRARRPALLKVFDKHPEELIRIGRAPDLRLMLDANKELKAALDKKSHVRDPNPTPTPTPTHKPNPNPNRARQEEPRARAARVQPAPPLHLPISPAYLPPISQVRELLESNPDLDRNRLNELVFSDAQLKDLYDSRPELKVRVRVRVRVRVNLTLS